MTCEEVENQLRHMTGVTGPKELLNPIQQAGNADTYGDAVLTFLRAPRFMSHDSAGGEAAHRVEAVACDAITPAVPHAVAVASPQKTVRATAAAAPLLGVCGDGAHHLLGCGQPPGAAAAAGAATYGGAAATVHCVGSRRRPLSRASPQVPAHARAAWNSHHTPAPPPSPHRPSGVANSPLACRSACGG